MGVQSTATSSLTVLLSSHSLAVCPALVPADPGLTVANQDAPSETSDLYRTAESLYRQAQHTDDPQASQALRYQAVTVLISYARVSPWLQTEYALESMRLGAAELLRLTAGVSLPVPHLPCFDPLFTRSAQFAGAYDFLKACVQDIHYTRQDLLQALAAVARLPSDGDCSAQVNRREKIIGLIHLLSEISPPFFTGELMQHFGVTQAEIDELTSRVYYEFLKPRTPLITGRRSAEQ